MSYGEARLKAPRTLLSFMLPFFIGCVASSQSFLAYLTIYSVLRFLVNGKGIWRDRDGSMPVHLINIWLHWTESHKPVRWDSTSVFGHSPGAISLASLNRTWSSPPRTPSQCTPCSGEVTCGRTFFDANIDLVETLSLTCCSSQFCTQQYE